MIRVPRAPRWLRSACRCLRPAGLLLAGVLAAAASVAAPVPGFYEVEVPVADQSPAAREAASRVALVEMLSRFTGLTDVPRDPAVEAALSQPDLYYSQFGFQTAPEGDGLLLRLQFRPDAVLRLVREAALPIWRTDRPLVLAWVVVDDGSGRRILAADGDDPLVASLRERARERGLPLRLPVMDLPDQMQVEPAAVWGRLPQILESASRRYGSELLLVGRAVQQAPGRWDASWEFWHDGEVHEVEQQGAAADALGVAAVDLAAATLAARYAVRPEQSGVLPLGVSAVQGAADYAELLRYLASFEFVTDVRVDAVAGDTLELSLTTAAQPDQLLELFRLDRKLVPEAQSLPGALRLVWQPR